MDRDLRNELSGLRFDNINFPKEREKYTNILAQQLKNEMGKDIHDVLNGKIKVKLSFKERFKYKWNYFVNKLFSIF